MRKGNKSKALIAVLALALALNVFGTALAEAPELESVLEFEPAVDMGEPTAPEAETPEAAVEEEVTALAAGDEEGTTVQPGSLFQYGDRYFRVKSGAANLFNGGGENGGFDTSVSPVEEGSGKDTLYSNTAAWTSAEGHNAAGCLAWNAGQVIWRHDFDPTKLYVMSAWYKFDGAINLNDGQRHLAGANDLSTDGTHYNEIGRNRPATGGWQQDFFVFKGISQSNGQFMYLQVVDNGGTLYMDDVIIYEVEELEAQLSITGHTLEAEDGTTYDVGAGAEIPAAGKYFHLIRYENELPNEYLLTGVLLLYKGNKLEKIFTVNTKTGRGTFSDTGMVAASGTVDIMFEIPEGEDVSQYGYSAFLVDRGKPFSVLGVPRETAAGDAAVNPINVYGASNAAPETQALVASVEKEVE